MKKTIFSLLLVPSLLLVSNNAYSSINKVNTENKTEVSVSCNTSPNQQGLTPRQRRLAQRLSNNRSFRQFIRISQLFSRDPSTLTQQERNQLARVPALVAQSEREVPEVLSFNPATINRIRTAAGNIVRRQLGL
ncbi:hypothetical protein [Tenacibaculum sp. M341]|uniref:hypothetical protein n=1 Tax=Tenacibaculum sp. M341 TaxID=2530339 RepID=UPI0010516A14|nr:hypothetical protein [Tenacibaculum sp. M341]TCI93058.1 hypothetical protein EYW44_05420 [Tenacibaculum sp. M341]